MVVGCVLREELLLPPVLPCVEHARRCRDIGIKSRTRAYTMRLDKASMGDEAFHRRRG